MTDYKPGDKYVIDCPVDPRNAIDGYGPGYENGTLVTVEKRTRNRDPLLKQPGVDKDGKPDLKLPATYHVWVKSEGHDPIWVQPDRIKPYADPAAPPAKNRPAA